MRTWFGVAAIVASGWVLGLSLVAIALTRAPIDRLASW